MADSRIRLQPLAAALHPDREVYVGWDERLQTYFAQVIDGQDEGGNDRLTVDLGGDIGDITYPGGVISALRPYAEISEDLGALLNISRVSTTPVVDDLRPDSFSYRQEQHVESELSRLYRPGGFVTGLTRDEVASEVRDHGWTFAESRATDTGHTETYRRGEQELTIDWARPDQDYDTERMLSPVRIDGERYGAQSRDQLSSVLAEDGLEQQIKAPGREEQAEERQSDMLAGGETQPDGQGREADLGAGTDEPWFDEPPDADEGFHSGLGT
jgi:hypothetical protein